MLPAAVFQSPKGLPLSLYIYMILKCVYKAAYEITRTIFRAR